MGNPLIPKKGDSKYKFVDVPHSAGILDDHAVRKSIQSQSVKSNTVAVDDNTDLSVPKVVNIIATAGALPAANTVPLGTLGIVYT